MRKLGLITLSLAVGLTFAPSARAHTFKDDGSITVLMHSDPDDDVVAASPATLYFSVFDQANHFTTADCDCGVLISEHGRVLLSAPLLPDPSTATIFSYQMPFTFPKQDTYQVVAYGNPNSPGQFQPFQVQYDLDVAAPPAAAVPPKNSEGLVDLIIAALLLTGGLALALRDKISYGQE